MLYYLSSASVTEKQPGSINEVESATVATWAHGVVKSAKVQHVEARKNYATLYRFVHRSMQIPEEFARICRARVRADVDNPCLLPVKHFFMVAAPVIRGEAEHQCSSINAYLTAEITKSALASRCVRASRIMRLAIEEHIAPDDFEHWYDQAGGATALLRDYQKKYVKSAHRKATGLAADALAMLSTILTDPAVKSRFGSHEEFNKLVALIPAGADVPDAGHAETGELKVVPVEQSTRGADDDGLSPLQRRILDHLQQVGRSRAREIATALGVGAATISSIAYGLEAAGALKRHRTGQFEVRPVSSAGVK